MKGEIEIKKKKRTIKYSYENKKKNLQILYILHDLINKYYSCH